MQDATTVYPPITPAWTNLAVTSDINKLDPSGTSSDDHRYDSASPQSDCLTIGEERLSPISNASASSFSSTLPPKKRYMQSMLANDSNKENDDLDTLIYNSAGKVQKHSCRRCSFVTTTKRNYWSHIRTHIRPEKFPKFPFVTDYKRHFEYHARIHLNSKPFKCQKCDYSGASKSMLDSHLKSHPTRRPYRCAECNFASKFASRLRRHLDKKGHEEGFVLDDVGRFGLENVIVSSRWEVETKRARVKATTGQSELRNGKKMMPVLLPAASFYYAPMYAGYAMQSAATLVVTELNEEPAKNTAPMDYNRLSPAVSSPTIREFEDTSAPLDLSIKNGAKRSAVTADDPVEDAQDVQQQIQYLRANLDNMHKLLWNFEQNYMCTGA